MSRSGVGAVRVIRALLLVLLVVGVTAVAALYVLGRIGRQDPARIAEQAARKASERDGDEGAYAIEGGSTRHTAMVGDRVLFEIRGDTFREGADGEILLEGVGIEMARDEGAYRLQGDRATWDPETNDARLEGSVLVEGPNRLVLRTEWLELRDSGKVVVAFNGSDLELGERFVGTAQNLRLDLERDEVLLNGGVRLATRDGAPSPLTLRARMITYDRAGRQVLARGNVRLVRPDGRLESLRLNLDLDADTDDIRVVRATGRVRGWWRMAEDGAVAGMSSTGDATAPGLASGGSGVSVAADASSVDATTPPAETPAMPGESEHPEVRRYDLRGMKLVALLTAVDQRPERIDLAGFRQSPAVLVAIDSAATRRQLTAADLAAGFDRGLLSWVTARGGAELVEVDASGATSRRASAADADALFDTAGELVRIQLDQEVTLEEVGVRASAEHATVDDRQRRTELVSESWVEVTNSQGTLLAPTVSFSHESGLMTAAGGVRATLTSDEGSALGPLGDSGSDEPVRVEADEALLRRDDGDFVFTGSARAWQGQTRLTADQIRGNQSEDALAASGSVETHWRAEPTGAAATGGNEPVDISAEHFDYGGGTESELVYEGTVVVRQAGRLLRCEHLTVTLDSERQADRMDCREKAALEDPAFERQVLGVRALYFPKLGEVVVSPPLKLVEPNRTIESPQRLWYRLEDGIFELGPDAPDPEREG